ncbi:hypothetical protein LINPERPRIM_LOCUS28592 [Linum perenne]
MPGNEVGDRIHNFFGQESSSQVQHHSQIADASWPGVSGNPWAGSQGHIATPFVADLKSRNLQQSVANYERGYGGQQPPVQHDMSFQQSIERTEHTRSQSQNQHPIINGFFQGHQGFQTRQNETNFLGVDTEPDRHNLTPKGFSAFDSHQGNGTEIHRRNPATMDSTESPVNFNFFGGQHQMNPHHSGIMQSLPRQPLGMGDMHLLQQQLILKQMQEFQRQRQHQMQQQQQESRQINIMNQASSLGKHALGGQSQSLFNGIPVQDAQGYAMQTEAIPANSNWQQNNMSSDMRGSSSGLGFLPEQNQAAHLMGIVPQQADQSLFGVPISGARVSSSHFSPIQMDKAPIQHMSSNSNSLLANHFRGSSNPVNVQDVTLGSGQGYQGRNMTGRVDSQGFDSGINLEQLQRANSQESSGPTQEFQRRQDGAGPSESPQEKTPVQAVSSQNVATLDPTEERILYGSDVNLWDAFGSSDHVSSGSFNTVEVTDTLGGAFSSLQSGTWSALMQSAVAETSSADASTAEEWSGQATERQTGNRQVSAVNDSGKQQTAWAGNSFQTASTLPSSFHRADVNNASMNMNEMQRVHQSGVGSSQDESERSQVNSFQKVPQQFGKGNAKWLDGNHQQKSVVEGSHNQDNAVHSADELSAKNTSHSLANQSGFPLQNQIGQTFNRQNGWNFIDSASSSTGLALKNQGTQNLLQTPSGNDQKSSVGQNIWRTDSVSNSAVEAVPDKFTGSPPVNTGDSDQNSTLDLSNMMTNQDSSQETPRGKNVDVWKHVDPAMSNKVQDKAHEAFESSRNNSLGDGDVNTLELHNFGVSQSSMNSFANMANARRNNWIDTNESGTVSAGKHKLSSQKPPVRKFQYHPMGDVNIDCDSSHSTASISRSDSTMRQVSGGLRGQEEARIGESKFTGGTTSLDRGIHEYTLNKSAALSHNMLELLHKVDHSSETGNSVYPRSSSQDPSPEIPETEAYGRTLQLQQNVSSASQGEKSTTGMVPMSFVQSFPRTLETLDGDGRNKTQSIFGQVTRNDHGRISSDLSPGFPYSRNHAQDLLMRETGREANANQSVNESFDKLVSQVQHTTQAVDRAQSSQSGQASVPDTSWATTCNDVASSAEVSRLDNSQNDKESGQQFPVLEAASTSHPYAVSGLHQDGASKMPSTLRTSISSKHPSFNTPPFRALPNVFESNIQSNSTTETNWSQKLEYQNPQRRFNSPSASGATSTNHDFTRKEQLEKDNSQQALLVNDFSQKTMSPLQGKDSIVNRVSSLYASSPGSNQMDIAAFGRSLRPNAPLNQNYALLHEVQDVNNREMDPSGRSLKRLKGSDGGLDQQLAASDGRQQLYGQTNMVRGASLNNAPSSLDDKRVSFSGRQTDEQHQNIPSNDMHGFNGNNYRNFADSNNAASGRGEHTQISPQMAPSWFNQYGTFKHGQVLSKYDPGKAVAMKHAELALSAGRSFNGLPTPSSLEAATISGDAYQHGIVKRSSTLIASEEFSFPQLSRPPTVDMSLFVVRPKKRKSATCDLVPWHKEMIKIPQRLQNISMAEVKWAKAVNRLSEKMEDDVEIINDGPPALRSKRRLILTTQLMQLLLHPPPAWVMSADAISQYESAAHFIARSTLGDVCGSLSGFANDSSPPSDNGNINPEKLRLSKSASDQYFSKVMEALITKTKKVESDLLRLDRSMSILDLRVECEDLEKFSVINRFAKFHGPGQTGGGSAPSPSPAAADSCSSSSSSSSNAQKLFLQRYVTAVPFPRNIPDRVQCLSL